MAFAPRSRVTLRPDAVAFDTSGLPAAEATYSRTFSTDEVLGEGGMGRVTSARDTRLGRRVAIKELRDEVRGQPDLWGRFVREAQIGAQLEHPNIVPIYGFELSPAGGPAFVMQLIDGESLGTYLDRARSLASHGQAGVPPLKGRISKLLPVLDAIAYAHGRGVLHRDLKPDNVMLGAHNVVLVTDWGIARVESDVEGGLEDLDGDAPAPAPTTVVDLGSSSTMVAASGPASAAPTMVAGQGGGGPRASHVSSKPVQTALGSVLGTPQYMSPEQAIGSVVGPPSDQYALGLILLELATLRTARSHDSTQAAYGQAVLGEQSPHMAFTGERLDPRLSAIIARATQKQPEDRYPDVDALAGDLRAYLRDEEVSVAPDSLARKIARHVQAHPGRAVATVSAIVLGLAAFALSALSSAATRAEAGRADSEALSRLASRAQADAKDVERYLLGMDAELLSLAEITRLHLERPLLAGEPLARLLSPTDLLDVPGVVKNPVDGLSYSYQEPVFVFLPGAGVGAQVAAQHLTRAKPDLIELYLRSIDERALRFPQAEQQALMESEHRGFARLLITLESGLFVQFPGRGEFPPAYDPRHADWYEYGVSRAGSTVTRPKFGPKGKTGRVALVRAIRAKGRLLGAANAGVWLKTLVGHLDPPGEGRLVDSFLAAPDGQEVVSRRVLETAETTSGEPEGFVPLPNVSSRALRSALARGEQQGYVVDGEDLYVYSRLAVEDWVMVHRYRARAELRLVR